MKNFDATHDAQADGEKTDATPAADVSDFPLRLSVCICTRNRPLEVQRAVGSVMRSSRVVHEVIVSDDSTNGDTRALFTRTKEKLRFVEGPRKGLCANRNNALNYVSGTHVLFIDDDVILTQAFVAEIEEALRAQSPDRRAQTIVVGLERKHGQLVFPGEQTFLGYQSRRYLLGEKVNTIVINSTVFPAALFAKIRFDENLIYGCDEVDIATRAVQLGFVNVLCLQAVNDHYPAEANRDYYASFVDASRLYVTFKRYYFTEGRRAKALTFALVAPFHLLGTRLRTRPLRALVETTRALTLAITYLTRMSGAGRATRGST